MLHQLPEIAVPKWLADLSPAAIMHEPFPLKEILQDSLYYPACRFDGEPIRHLGGNILSFIYVDYGVSQSEFTDSLKIPGFRGYNLIATRSVTELELVPNGWQPIPLIPSDDKLSREDSGEDPFYCWLVFQRDEATPASHGPFRFSLLYLYADGVAAFQSLYVANSIIPKVVAIINPGNRSWGRNWTDFSNPRKVFTRCVLGNPSKQPEFLLCGDIIGRDIGKLNTHKHPCWPLYREHVCCVEKRERYISDSCLWRKLPQDHHTGLALLRKDFEDLLFIRDTFLTMEGRQIVGLKPDERKMQSYTELFMRVISQINEYQLNETRRVSQQENVHSDDLDTSFIFYRDQIEPRIPAMMQAHKYWFDW
jgi:hypothetical protein